MEQGHFTGERGVDDKKERWAEHGDTIDRFQSEILELTGEAGDAHPKADVYALDTAFCEYLGQEAGTQHKLTRELKKDKRIDDKEQDGTRYSTGVKLAKTNIGGREPLDNRDSLDGGRQERFG